MQPETYNPSTTGDMTSTGGMETTTYEKQPSDYWTDFTSTTGNWFGQVTGFLFDRPLVIGSLVIAIAGAITGSRIAQMMAMRRRRAMYGRAVETLGVGATMLAGLAKRTPRDGAMSRLRDRGMGVFESTRDVSSSIVGGLPMVGPRIRPGEEPNTLQKIGWGLSLIPIIWALMRNPLIRGLGFRYALGRFGRR